MQKSTVYFGFLCVLLIGIAACTPIPQACMGVGDKYDTDVCLRDTGIELNDTSFCDAISNDGWQLWCYTDVAKALGDVSICEELSGTEAQNCIKDVALITQNVSSCAAIDQSDAGDRCYFEFAVSSEQSDLCKNVVGTDLFNKCYVEIAESTNTYQLCTFIRDDVRRSDACIFRVSIRNNATQGCTFMSSVSQQDLCYLNQAVKQLDNTICEQVVVQKMQQACGAAVRAETLKAEARE